MVTGRIASKIVNKAAMAGVPVLASLSMASNQGARAARAASFSGDVGDSVGETRRRHMRQIHLGLLIVGLLLVAATAQAGEMLTLVKNQICTRWVGILRRIARPTWVSESRKGWIETAQLPPSSNIAKTSLTPRSLMLARKLPEICIIMK